MQLGPGWSTVWNDDRTLDGVGLGMGLAIGGSIVPNLALHLDLQTTWMLSPSADRPEDDDVSNIGVQSLGLGVTYYIMPVELFLSASVGIGRLAFEDDDGQTKDTDAGIALDFLFGKEWWVGADWGIGVAAQLLYLHVTDYLPGDEGLDTVAINVLFTATYN